MATKESMMPLLAQTFIDSKTGIHFNAVASTSKTSSPQRRRVIAGLQDPAKTDILSCSNEVLAARYRFVKEIGFGNWGSVWLCQKKEEQGATVSIKLVHRSKNPTSSARVRSLWQEYKCIRALRGTLHPNIINFTSFIITPAYALITMDHHPRCIPVALPETTASLYFRGLISAVDWLHSHGYTHNDIKPANILLSAQDEPILIDFGFAQSHPITEGANRFLSSLSWGTPEYLDPLRARGILHDERASDTFALGCTMWEVVVGRTPFEASDLEEFLTKTELEVYYQRTLTGSFYGEYNVSAEFESLIKSMVEPDASKRLRRCGLALSHPLFNPFASPSSTPVRNFKKAVTPQKKGARDENSLVKFEVHRDVSTPVKTQPSPSSKSFSPRPLVLGDASRASTTPSRKPLVLGERNGVSTPSHKTTPSKVLSPTKTPTRSRIPVRKVDISTPTALSPINASKYTLPSKHLLKRVPAPRRETSPPPVPQLSPSEGEDEKEVLASSRETSLRDEPSSSDDAYPRSSSPATSASRAPSPTVSAFHKAATPELQPGDGVVESTFPSSERWDVAELQGRRSPSLPDHKWPTGSLTSKLRKLSVRKATPSFFGRKKSSAPLLGRPRAATVSSRPTASMVDDRDAVTMPIDLANKSPEDLENEKARLESFSRHIQDLIARKTSQPPLPRRSVQPSSTITDMSILSATEVLEFRAQVARELEEESRSQSVEPLKPRPLRSASISRRAGASTSQSDRPATKIRPSLIPSFVGGQGPSPPTSPQDASQDVEEFRKGHRRIPTAIRDVPPIYLTETESDSDYRADTPCSERPLSPPVQLEVGRILPTWVPNGAESNSDKSDDDADLDEPTLTLATPPRARRPIKHSPRKTPTKYIPRKSPPIQSSAETLYKDYTYTSPSSSKSPYIEPVKFDTMADNSGNRSQSRASTWASGKSHSRSRSVLSFIFSGSSSRASTPSMSVESFSAVETTDDEAPVKKTKGGRFKRVVKKLLR